MAVASETWSEQPVTDCEYENDKRVYHMTIEKQIHVVLLMNDAIPETLSPQALALPHASYQPFQYCGKYKG
jgi:hypothetical protein